MPLTSAFSTDPRDWDQFVARHSAAHVLQTSPWGTLKSQFDWEPERVGLTDGGELVAGAQILYRRLPLGLGRLAYVPKGPLTDWDDVEQARSTIETIGHAARAHDAIALTLEPPLRDEPDRRRQLEGLGFAPSPFESVQPRRTIVIDLTPDEDEILMAMKSKTRYNIRLAGRKGVTVRAAETEDLPAFHKLMRTTGARNEFGIHSPAYYDAAYRLFVSRGWARLLLAEVERQPVAALMVFALGTNAWYFYGASASVHREKMPTYLLQWEAMRWAKSRGCTTYDLWGIPDEDEEALEATFTERSDGLWGVYRFKRGFGGQVVRTIGAWDRVFAPLRYRLYRWALALRGRA